MKNFWRLRAGEDEKSSTTGLVKMMMVVGAGAVIGVGGYLIMRHSTQSVEGPLSKYASHIWGGNVTETGSGTSTGSSGSGGSLTATPVPPTITSVSWDTTSGASPSLVLDGSDFASGATVAVDDETQGWQTGNASGVTPNYGTETSTTLSVTSFSDYGSGNFVFEPNDALAIIVTNPDGDETTYDTTYPGASPTLSLQVPSTAAEETPVDVTGTLTSNGQPLSNASVRLTATGGTIQPSLVSTNGNGEFAAQYTAGSTAGTYTVTASADGVQQSGSIAVSVPSLTITSNAPSSGAEQDETYTISGTLTLNGQPMDNQTVTLTPSGTDQGGTLSSTTATTNGNGEYSVEWTTPDTTGTVQILASADNETADYQEAIISPVVTIATNVPFSGAVTDQKYTVTGEVSAGGSALANQTVTLSASAGSFAEATVTTNSSGDYTATWTAPAQSGNVTLTATDGTGSASTSVSVVTPTVTIATNAPSSGATVGESYTVTGSVTSGGTALANQTVTLSASAGSFAEATVTTNSRGDYTATWTAPAQSGNVTLTATDGGASANTTLSVSVPSVNYTLSLDGNEALSGTANTSGGGATTTTPVISGETYTLEVTTEDASGNPVPDQSVTIAISGGTMASNSGTTNSSGTFTTTWTTPSTNGAASVNETIGFLVDGTQESGPDITVYRPQFSLAVQSDNEPLLTGVEYGVTVYLEGDGVEIPGATVDLSASSGTIDDSESSTTNAYGQSYYSWTAPAQQESTNFTMTTGGDTGTTVVTEETYTPTITLSVNAPTSGALENSSYTVSSEVTADGTIYGAFYPMTITFSTNAGTLSPTTENYTPMNSSGAQGNDYQTTWSTPSSATTAVITATVGSTTATLDEPVVSTVPTAVNAFSTGFYAANMGVSDTPNVAVIGMLTGGVEDEDASYNGVTGGLEMSNTFEPGGGTAWNIFGVLQSGGPQYLLETGTVQEGGANYILTGGSISGDSTFPPSDGDEFAGIPGSTWMVGDQVLSGETATTVTMPTLAIPSGDYFDENVPIGDASYNGNFYLFYYEEYTQNVRSGGKTRQVYSYNVNYAEYSSSGTEEADATVLSAYGSPVGDSEILPTSRGIYYNVNGQEYLYNPSTDTSGSVTIPASGYELVAEENGFTVWTDGNDIEVASTHGNTVYGSIDTTYAVEVSNDVPQIDMGGGYIYALESESSSEGVVQVIRP